MIIFETERLLVRAYDFELDADDFFLLNSDEEVMRYIRPVKSREECNVFLKEIIAKDADGEGMGRWAAVQKENNQYIGSFAIIPIENTSLIQLGYALVKPSWGKGYASELTRGGLKYYFSNTEASEIYGVAETPNIASHRVLLKNGFVKDSIKWKGRRNLFIIYTERFLKVEVGGWKLFEVGG